MPPKKVDKKVDKGQQKALEKQKQKVVEEKTFGLKNKNKSKAVQKYIQGIQSSAKPRNISESALIEKAYQQKEEKAKQQQQAAFLASIFRGTEQIKKIDADQAKKIITPTTIKADQQIDPYVDQRDLKHGDSVTARHHRVDTMCKFFLEAVEKKQYGWFWVCPNGGDACQYRHCLPPGYVLETEMEKFEPDEEVLPLEELLEESRQNLKEIGPKLTLETFLQWKEQRKAKKESKKMEKAASTKGPPKHISGRDLFTLDPTIFIDDAEAAESKAYNNESRSCEGSVTRQDDQDAADNDSIQITRKDVFLDNALDDWNEDYDTDDEEEK